MRTTILIAALACLGGCTTATDDQYVMAEDDREQLQRVLGDRVMGEERRCLPPGTSFQSTVIDERTIVYRRGSQRYVQTFATRCPDVDRIGSALLTRNFGTNGPCENEIAQVVDTRSGITYGGCAYGPFVEYVDAD